MRPCFLLEQCQLLSMSFLQPPLPRATPRCIRRGPCPQSVLSWWGDRAACICLQQGQKTPVCAVTPQGQPGEHGHQISATKPSGGAWAGACELQPRWRTGVGRPGHLGSSAWPGLSMWDTGEEGRASVAKVRGLAS